MKPFPWPDVLVIAGLILLNGLFAMSELAIVSARPNRLKVAAERGSGGAPCALSLSGDPGKLLSTAQIGITLIGIARQDGFEIFTHSHRIARCQPAAMKEFAHHVA